MKIEIQLKNLLLEAGLSEAEVLVYLELLKSPAQNKWELVVRTGLNRNKVYRAFDSLAEKKLVNSSANIVEALSLEFFLSSLEQKTKKLAKRIKKFSPFLKIPHETIEKFELCETKDKILEDYIMMSQLKYGVCCDFGDLENFVPVLGGMDPVFKFRVNRYKQMAKNFAICTTVGPYTSCMARKQDMENFKSNIELLKIDFKKKWIIFSDSNDHIMFNDFSDKENPSSVVVKSKLIADTQRLQFKQFAENLAKF